MTSSTKMQFTGDREVIKRILRKQKLLAKNDPKHTDIKTVLLLPGGGQGGVFEAGVAIALEKFGLINAFDYVVGVSTGSAVGYYFLAQEAALGTTIYFQDNVKNKMVNFFHPWKILDIDTLEEVFRNVKPINIESLKNSRADFLVGVTNAKTGKGEYLRPKEHTDPLSCIIASVKIPVVAGPETVEIKGKTYVDGWISNPLPISYLLKELKVDTILIGMPGTIVKKDENIFKIIRGFLVGALRPELAETIDQLELKHNEEIKYVTGEKDLPENTFLGVIHPHENSKSLIISMDEEALKNAALLSKKFTYQLLKEISLELNFGVFGIGFNYLRKNLNRLRARAVDFIYQN